MTTLPITSTVPKYFETYAGARQSSRLSLDPVIFANDFDRRPFYLDHDLATHPLFELSAMAALSERLHPALVEWNSGHAGAYAKTEPGGPSTLSCKETILSVGERSAWVLLREIEHDSEYKALLDELLDEIRPYSERSRPGMCRRQGFLFISSRAAVTPYHFDPEHNFLLQVRGRKTVHMWDPNNHEVMAESAFDDYYANFRTNRDQPYRDDFLTSAWVLPLNAGQGVHFPLHAPHWVKTESDTSISFSITFRSRESNRREAVHTANGYARRLGLMPPAPRTSRWWDMLSQVIFASVKEARYCATQFMRVRRLSLRLAARVMHRLAILQTRHG